MTISRIAQVQEQVYQRIIDKRTNYTCSVLTSTAGTLLIAGGSVAVVTATPLFAISGAVAIVVGGGLNAIALMHAAHRFMKYRNDGIERKANIHIPIILKQWRREAPLRELRIEAESRILRFLNCKEKKYLDLSYLNLSSLPDIFNYLLCKLNLSLNKLVKTNNLSSLIRLNLSGNKLESLPDISGMQELKILNLSFNKFTTLADTINNLSSLVLLNLSENKLESLPDISSIQELRTLDLSNNKLCILPDAINSLSNLIRLYLSGNKLETLPNISNLQRLKVLNLSKNKLATLSNTINNLSSLTHLNLSGNELETLPDVSGMQELEVLNLSNNKLESLPCTIGSLSALIHLYLNNNPSLPGFPIEILDLPRTCLITIGGNNLSSAILVRLREITAHPEYSGPRITYSVVDRVIKRGKSIEESLTDLYRIAGRAPIEFSYLEKTEELRSWLNRLSDIADFQKRGYLQKALATKVLDYLTQASGNQEFYEIFYSIIQGAAETCGDRVALSILHLGTAYKLTAIDLKDLRALADFLKGLWAVNILEDIARNKVLTLPFFDEIEAYLGYPIKLKEELNLPIDIQEMLYFNCSALTDEDLQGAKDFVLSKQANQEEYLEFLINHDTWIKALSVNYQEEYQSILDEKGKASESAQPNYVAIEQTFRKHVKRLTKNALLLKSSA